MYLRKPNEAVRPVAGGELLRRLTSSVALARVTKDVKQLLQPYQFGVATRRGGEIVTHSARLWADILGDDPQFACLQVNLGNVFNVISREVIIRETERHLPAIAA